MANKTEQALTTLLNEYIDEKIDQQHFSKEYSKLLLKLESEIEEIYHPLHVIVPDEKNSERAWQESMREMYIQEIANLDKLLENHEPSYSEMLTQAQQIELCKEALGSIVSASSDREAKKWIEASLVLDEEFNFSELHQRTQMEKNIKLYETDILHESFLLSALNGMIKPLPVAYETLIDVLIGSSNQPRPIWLRCSDNDGFIGIENTTWYTEKSDEPENINWIEFTTSQDTQGGECHLILLDENREWMLVHSNDFSKFTIRIFGTTEYIDSISKKLSL